MKRKKKVVVDDDWWEARGFGIKEGNVKSRMMCSLFAKYSELLNDRE